MDAAATGGTAATGTGGSASGTGGVTGTGGGASGMGGSEGGMAGSAGGAAGAIPVGGSSGGDGGVMYGGSTDVMFPCCPCSPHWVCGGYADAAETDVVLTPEADGCYLAGLSGHALLSPDGTVTENGVPIGRAQKFGPQVGFYYPDGGAWFYCGGNLPCSP